MAGRIGADEADAAVGATVGRRQHMAGWLRAVSVFAYSPRSQPDGR
jgi:hypothetical protein